MKKSLFSLCTAALLVTGLMSFAGPDPQKQDKKQTNKTKMQKDTASDTRIDHNNAPALHKTDSLPMPKPVPDTMHMNMH